MSGHPVDTFRGRLEAGRIVLEFGSPQSGVAGEVVSLTDRVALPPSTAQRLLVALDETLRRRPKQFAAPAPAQATPELRLRGETPRNAAPDDAGALGAQVLAEVQALGVPLRSERSFRIARAGLQAHRFLLTLTKSDLGADARERVSGTCARLNMPAALQELAFANFPDAGAVHFGFEGAAQGSLVKLYLEQAIAPARADAARATGEPLLQHIAFKWDPLQGAGVVTRYLWHPLRSAEAIAQRLAQVYRGADPQAERIAREILAIAAARAPAERLQYLEVEEEGNGRRSFDLNVYDAGLKVQDLRPALNAMRDHFAVRPGQFQALYDQVKSRPLGHVAGGTHRNEAGFFNIYHAAA